MIGRFANYLMQNFILQLTDLIMHVSDQKNSLINAIKWRVGYLCTNKYLRCPLPGIMTTGVRLCHINCLYFIMCLCWYLYLRKVLSALCRVSRQLETGKAWSQLMWEPVFASTLDSDQYKWTFDHIQRHFLTQSQLYSLAEMMPSQR